MSLQNRVWRLTGAIAVTAIIGTGQGASATAATTTPDSDVKERIVTAALAEVGTQGGDKYTGGTGKKWCSEFVSWSYKQGGIEQEPGGVLTNVPKMREWFTQHGQYHARGDGLPQRGDWMSFRNGTHSGLVVYAGDWNGYTWVWTVEGNMGNQVRRFVYWIGDPEIDGWGHVA